MLYDDPLKEFINLDVFQTLSGQRMICPACGTGVLIETSPNANREINTRPTEATTLQLFIS